MKWWQWLSIGLLIGLSIAFTTHAQAPTNLITDTTNTNPYIKENVIFKPYIAETPINTPLSYKGTSVRNKTSISVETIRQYLESKGSPLAAYSTRISESPYSGTILGICTIEQYGCAKAPGTSPYNFWGIMSNKGLARYASYEAGIDAIDNWLASHEANHPTIQSLNGYYVQPASNPWLNTVLKVKTFLENPV